MAVGAAQPGRQAGSGYREGMTETRGISRRKAAGNPPEADRAGGPSAHFPEARLSTVRACTRGTSLCTFPLSAGYFWSELPNNHDNCGMRSKIIEQEPREAP